jgi:hypothetical protein
VKTLTEREKHKQKTYKEALEPKQRTSRKFLRQTDKRKWRIENKQTRKLHSRRSKEGQNIRNILLKNRFFKQYLGLNIKQPETVPNRKQKPQRTQDETTKT